MANLCLPRPGFKRVEAWMLVQAAVASRHLDGDDGGDRSNPAKIDHHATNTRPTLVLDPLCGKGTFLVEFVTTMRALDGNTNQTKFLGVDQSETQLQDALLNLDATGCTDQVSLKQGDARNLHWLEDDSVAVILTCPPFGRQFSRGSDLNVLYREWIDEWARVLDPHCGRMALLVDIDHEEDALAAIRGANRKLKVVVHREPFRLGRLQATVIVAQRFMRNTRYRPSPQKRFAWESDAKESRAEWARLRAARLQQLVPYTAK
jgi:SAM-dependent methyltransferase